ncbi:MAG: tetratricopeptide repeat protein [Balneolaceae bacterium]
MSFEEKFKKGYELLHEQDLDHSLDIARELQKMNSESAEGYMLEAEVMQKLNQWEASVKALHEAIEKDPESGRLFNLRGYSLLNMEKIQEAEEDFTRAIRLDDLPAAHRNRVLCQIMSGRGQEAIRYLLDRIKSDPSDVENWIMMGDLMKKGGHSEKAESYYQQAAKMDPDNDYVQRQLSGKQAD